MLGYKFHENINKTYELIILDLWMKEEGKSFKRFLDDLSKDSRTNNHRLALELFTYIMKIDRALHSHITPLSLECKEYAIKINCDIDNPRHFEQNLKKYISGESTEQFDNRKSAVIPQVQFFIECLLNIDHIGELLRHIPEWYVCNSNEDLIKAKNHITKERKRRAFRG